MTEQEIRAIRDLEETYQTAFQRLNNKILTAKASGRSTLSDTRLLVAVNSTLSELEAKNIAYIKEYPSRGYKRAREQTIAYLRKSGIDVEGSKTFVSIHERAVKTLQENLYNDLQEKLIQVGRLARDNLREITLEAAKMQTAGGGTEKQIIKETSEKIADLGLQYITYNNGVKMPIPQYVAMAVKTTASAAVNVATINTQLEYEQDLVKISFHSTSCGICAPFQGRVYSITGKRKNYPYIGEINQGNFKTYGTIHPNCRHRALPYVRDLDQNADATEEISNLPFEDNRTDYSKKRYENRQRINRDKRQIQKLKAENEVLQALDTVESKDQLKRNKERIKRLRADISSIEQWELDTIGDNELFVKSIVK